MKKSLPRVLLVSDVRGWAFDQNLKDMAEYLKDDFDFSFFYIEDFLKNHRLPDLDSFDTIFTPYHKWDQLNDYLPWHKNNILGSLRASMMFPELGTSLPGPREASVVARYKAFHVVNQRNFEDYSALCNNVVLLTNPVNTRRFPSTTKPRKKPVFCWNGNPNHRMKRHDIKGFYSIIQKYFHANKSKKIHVASYANETRQRPSAMPAFYQKATISVCASKYEGASNSTMEAMAAGLMLITTNCGNHADIALQQLTEGSESGILFFDGTLAGFEDAMSYVGKLDGLEIARLGLMNRQHMNEHWSWHAWADRYKKFLMKGVEA